MIDMNIRNMILACMVALLGFSGNAYAADENRKETVKVEYTFDTEEEGR